jgi:hypothetical protein
MRGIDGVNDGQQIYSYDADFQDSKSQDVRSLFTYQTPALEAGVVMSEEIALTMPKAFIFRKLDNGTCAVTLNTYLGRDYMGSTGRFGNYLSHSIICSEEEYAYYPCEFYGSEMLRDSMTYEEVNNSEKPLYLPVPELLRGYYVNINSVIEFLGEDNRVDIFKNMLHAMLSFEREHKRLVICDDPDNIIMWIAALEYTLPLKLALNINFTTYDYDPSLSRSQICGVVPKGTKYSPEGYENLQSHFIFDIYRKDTVNFDNKGEFYDFIEVAMLFSYDILKDFHEFLVNSYSYSKASLEYYNAYSLYKLRSDGISGFDRQSFMNAVSFAEKFANVEEKVALTKQLLAEKDKIAKFDDEYSLEVFRYILGSYDFLSTSMQEKIKSFVIEKIFNSFRETGKSEKEFIKFYKNIGQLCDRSRISIDAGLIHEDNQQKILAAMQYDVSNWKLAFIITTLCSYVKDKAVPVNRLYDVESSVGRLYAGIVQSVYKTDGNNGYLVVTKILDEFSNNHEYLTNMALSLERVLLDLPSGEAAVRFMWKYFYNVIVTSQYENRNSIFTILNNCNRTDQMYGLFESLLNSNRDSINRDALFVEHYDHFVTNNSKYSKKYLPYILGTYYEYIKRSKNRDISQIEEKLFYIIHQNKLGDVPFVDELIDNIVNKIPIERPSKENYKIITDIFDYNFNYRRHGVRGKVLLIFVGMNIEKIKSHKDLRPAMEGIERIINGKKVDLFGLTEKDANNYLEWIVPYITDSCQTSNELIKIYELFNMSPRVSEIYMTMCAKDYLKQSKDINEHCSFYEFLKFLFTVGNVNEREATGRVLCKLNKQKLEIMDRKVKTIFFKDKKALRYWDEINEIALSTNPLLNSINNFLKRKKF